MSELLSLQKKFQDHLFNSTNEIYNDIVDTKQVSTDVRLAIYSQAYRSRLMEALATHYPVIQYYLGDEQFEALANDYLDCNPSQYRSIRWFGDTLDVFLKVTEPYNLHPYLSELAKIEWTMTLVFDAKNCDAVSLEALNNVPPESWIDMRLTLHPSVHLIQLSWNSMLVWDAITREEPPCDLQVNTTPVTWVLWRNNLINCFYSLAHDEACALNTLHKGLTFGDICESLCEWMNEDEVALRAVSLLKEWISHGLIVKIEY